MNDTVEFLISLMVIAILIVLVIGSIVAMNYYYSINYYEKQAKINKVEYIEPVTDSLVLLIKEIKTCDKKEEKKQ